MAGEKTLTDTIVDQSLTPTISEGDIVDASIAVNAKESEKVKKEKEAQKGKEGLLYKVGKGSVAEARSKSAWVDPNYKKDMGIEKDKAQDDPISEQINVLLGTLQNAKPGDPMYEQAMSMLAMVNQGAKAAFVKGHYDGLNAALKSEGEYNKNTISKFMSAYWTSKGVLNNGAIDARVNKLIGDKPETSSGALDQLKANGAGEMDMPDLPETDKAAMTEMIISSLADTGKNIALMLGGGQNMQAAALATSASERSFESASNWMAMDLANYKQKKDKVTALNFELAEKYKGDIINMTAEFEQRASADERAYNQLRINATLQEYDTAWKVMGMDKASLDRIGQIGIEINNANNREQEINSGRQQQVNLENARLRQAIGANIAAMDEARMAERKLILQGIQGMVKKMQGLDGQGINGSVHAYWYTNQILNLDPKDTPIIVAGNNSGLRAFGAVKRVVQEGGDFTPDNGNQAIENLVILAQKKLIPNNLNNETIKTLGTTKLDMSMSADVISANTKLDLQVLPENNSTHVYFVGSLLNAAGSALEVDANDKVQTAKNTKSELMKSNPYGI